MPATKAAPKLPKISEREILAQVLAGLAAFGIEPERQNTGAFPGANGRMVRCGKKGDADVGFILPRGPNRGIRVEMELKAKGKKPTPEQWDKIMRVNAAGGFSFYSDDAVQCLHVVRRLLDGWRIEIDANRVQWVSDEPTPEGS